MSILLQTQVHHTLPPEVLRAREVQTVMKTHKRVHSVQRISQSVDTSHFTAVNFCVGIGNAAGRFAKQMPSKMLSSGKPQKFRRPSLMRCKAWATCRQRPVKSKAIIALGPGFRWSRNYEVSPCLHQCQVKLDLQIIKGQRHYKSIISVL